MHSELGKKFEKEIAFMGKERRAKKTLRYGGRRKENALKQGNTPSLRKEEGKRKKHEGKNNFINLY